VRTAATGLACTFDRAPDLPRRVVVDPLRLGQILSNLIDNAIKATETGTIRVRAGAEAETDAVRLLLTVEDEGPGLDSERLFEPYVQGAAGARRGGLGLGLAIVKTLAERMDGSVRAEPRARGTAFVVRVRCPIASDPGEIPDAEPAPVPRGYACLVVDDNAVCRALATTLLDGLGHRATPAGSVEEALRLLETQVFDIAFVDLRMAPTDGLETARRIRGLGARGRLPLVALTADARRADMLRAGGFAAHVAKPVTAVALAAAMARAMGTDGREARKSA
jgi:CheY-like chemotaxis protein/anti-sigma regulatory factor (Ser/Thr protein kinase)